MPGTSDSRIFRSRIAQLIALGGALTTAACTDATAPKQIVAPQAPTLSVGQSAGDELGSLSASLDDMTGWSLASLTDDQSHANIVGILNSLKGHLKSGKITASQQDVADARAFLESLSEAKRVEIGAVGVTLDLIQSTLDKASQ
jgi:hypothetical protein